ncbi:hypothetical protein [Methylobacterium flocculans]|uniref:hypothetical protein n=1 Tax=Methylobacterium flocculans TaxID=2984843 RepID=UPI0021F32829|nr:hypothetical protein [Methylobacterium sp. FF17]
MRNHITPANAAWPNASHQANLTATSVGSNQRMDLVNDASESHSLQNALELEGAVVKPASDFGGFGSFSG